MATQLNDEPLELEADDLIEGDEPEQQDEPEADEPEDDSGDADEPEDLVFADASDEPSDAEAPPWAKHLRERNSQIAKENRELKQQLAARVVEEPDVIVGPRPGIYDEGIDGDEQLFNSAMDAWETSKEAKAAQDRKREDASRRAQDEWNRVERRYTDGLARLNVPAKQEAVDAAFAELSGQQKAVILKHADDPARFLTALGKNPARLEQIASIEDPFALTKAMTRMEAQLKQTKAPRPPEPSRHVRGTAIGSTDRTLARLEAEAEKSGDRSKVIAYKANKDN